MNQDLLTAMYGDDAVDPKPIPLERSSLRSRMIRVGAIEYEVPTVDYVRQLEQLVRQQTVTIDTQRRAIERITSLLQSTRSFLRRGDRLHEVP